MSDLICDVNLLCASRNAAVAYALNMINGGSSISKHFIKL